LRRRKPPTQAAHSAHLPSKTNTGFGGDTFGRLRASLAIVPFLKNN